MLTGVYTQVTQKVINYKNFVIRGQYNELSVSSIPREYDLCGCGEGEREAVHIFTENYSEYSRKTYAKFM